MCVCVCVCVQQWGGESESCRPAMNKSHCPTFYREAGLLKQIKALRWYAIIFLLHEVNSLSPLFFTSEGAMVCLCYLQEYRFYEPPFFLPDASSPQATDIMLHDFPTKSLGRKGRYLRHSSVDEQVLDRRKLQAYIQGTRRMWQVRSRNPGATDKLPRGKAVQESHCITLTDTGSITITQACSTALRLLNLVIVAYAYYYMICK